MSLEISLHNNMLNKGKIAEHLFYTYQYYSEKYKKARQVYNSPFIAKGLERALGDKKYQKMREFTLGDLYRKVLGEHSFYGWDAMIYNWANKSRKGKRMDKIAKGIQRFAEKEANKSLYEFSVDGLTLNAFSYPVGLGIEKVIFKVSWPEHLRTRLAGLFTNTIGGDSYGMWNDHVIKKFKVGEESEWGKGIIDRLGVKENSRTYKAYEWFNKKNNFLKRWSADDYAFGIGQFVIYFANMSFGGIKTGKKFLIGLATTLGAGALGMVYGPVRRRVRFWFDLPNVIDVGKSAGLEIEYNKKHNLEQ